MGKAKLTRRFEAALDNIRYISKYLPVEHFIFNQLIQSFEIMHVCPIFYVRKCACVCLHRLMLNAR